MGRVIIEEFNQDDANDDIDMSIVCEVQGDLTNRTKKALTSEVKKELLRVIGELRNELSKIDANEEKIAKDKFERE
jgi:predicted nucleotidyltransferase